MVLETKFLSHDFNSYQQIVKWSDGYEIRSSTICHKNYLDQTILLNFNYGSINIKLLYYSQQLGLKRAQNKK